MPKQDPWTRTVQHPDGALYLGDGAYAAPADNGDPLALVIYTSDGLTVSNRVYLERSALSVLITLARDRGLIGEDV